MAKNRTEFLGFMAIAMGTGIVILLVKALASDVQIVDSIRSHAPWIAAHMDAISWAAAGVLFITGMALPPILMLRDVNDGGDRLSRVGSFFTSFWFGMCLLAVLWIGTVALRI